MFGIREAYDNGDGAVVGWSADAIDVSGDSTDDLRGTLERMMESLEQDVLDLDALSSQSDASPVDCGLSPRAPTRRRGTTRFLATSGPSCCAPSSLAQPAETELVAALNGRIAFLEI